MRLISNCCGAKVAYEDLDKGTGLCCDCKEWCEFFDEDTEEDNATFSEHLEEIKN